MAMRWIKTLLVALLLAATPARAEIAWLDAPGSYELAGADLFKLRSELPPELNESLKAIRNQVFADEAAFRDALAQALLTDEFRAAWTERFTLLTRATAPTRIPSRPRAGSADSLPSIPIQASRPRSKEAASR
jgi:hypothetical protein